MNTTFPTIIAGGVPAVGPTNARILIVGEAPGVGEVRLNQPLVGTSGRELTKMLVEAGIDRAQCRITNVCQIRPPNNDIDTLFLNINKHIPGPELSAGIAALLDEIDRVRPNIIITLGNIPLWALTSHWGVTKWRGSTLSYETASGYCCKLLPTYHPDVILRQWDLRAIAVSDLRRAAAHASSPALVIPDYNFQIRPSIESTLSTLAMLQTMVERDPTPLAVDIETRAGHIACIGIAWSRLDAICIPLMCVEDDDGYWPFDHELAIIRALRRLLTNPNAHVVGQNFIYDAQFFWRWYGFVPHTTDDTMVMQHIVFAGMSKGLDFLASLYCAFYQYWKDEGKEWDPSINESQLWAYNCKDAVNTFEIAQEIVNFMPQLNLLDQYHQRMEYWWSVFAMTVRGSLVDQSQRNTLRIELANANTAFNAWLVKIIGHPLNVKSPKQLKEFFYDELHLPPIVDRKTHKVSTNYESLQKLAAKEPLIWPLVDAMLAVRSIGVFISTFLDSRLDDDGRMRSSWNIAGPETYRLSSSQNPFGNGMNMQNIPSGDRKRLPITLPNIRNVFIPPPGHTHFDLDLDRADLQVVVWEADDADLKRQLRKGVDLHIMNGILLAGGSPPDEDELIESHANYPEHKMRYKRERQLAKNFVHGTNYGGGPKTMAAVCGISIAHCTKLQSRWFAIHPGIRAWHDRIVLELQTKRFVTNRFGYRRYYFGRIDGILPEALAWIPQSTIAIVTAIIQDRVELSIPDIHITFQVHDSIAGHYPTHLEATLLPQFHQASQVIIPYSDPLIIPTGIKTSTKSWGECSDTTPAAKSWGKQCLTTSQSLDYLTRFVRIYYTESMF